MDPNATKQNLLKLIKLLREILSLCDVEENKKNIVESLTKMENKFHALAEAREHLVYKDAREKEHEVRVTEFERRIQKER